MGMETLNAYCIHDKARILGDTESVLDVDTLGWVLTDLAWRQRHMGVFSARRWMLRKVDLDDLGEDLIYLSKTDLPPRYSSD
mmetsp:Transcript_17547/g.37993  ORF Transcript_17547/g.37993 Transcript_17547/m.37993 type:complete len:82 (+) Transcript_17547:142-387(+)